ncbi:MAG: ABC transporter ATP-binding protein, partial [Acetobacteraceae bacterium]
MSATLDLPPRVATQAATLSVEGLSVTYPVAGGALAAVRDVSFAIAPGEAFGLIGESGSGKSTIAYSIMRYLRGATAAGRVVLEGQDIMALPEAALAAIRGRLAAMVYQDPMSALNPALRIGEQIAEVVRLHRGASRAEAAARAVALLAQVQLPDPTGMAARYPHQLSGGQQQRVVIAMALACDPKLLIMDEPTTGLDVTTEAVILDLVNDLRRAAGVAVLFISHNIGVVAKVCDRVGVLYAGQMVEQGSMAEVLGRPRHPYTIGLMRALPSVDGPRRHLAAIPGRLPDLRDVPPGCIFAPRCPATEAVCSAEMPALLGTPHASRCHFRDTLALPPPAPLPETAAEAAANGRPLLQMVGLEKSFGGGLRQRRGRRQGERVAEVAAAGMRGAEECR